MSALQGAQAIEHLMRRLDAAEREASDARLRAESLLRLQQTLTALTMLRDEHVIVSTMLDAITGTLGFSRAIFVRTERADEIDRELPCVVASVEHDLRTGLRGNVRNRTITVRDADRRTGYACGRAGDLIAPIVDLRSWFVLAPLHCAKGIIGYLYADDSNVRTLDEWACQLVTALGSVGAVALENARLVSETIELASRDPLTGLLNRRAFQERFVHELERSRRHRRSLTYVMIDVDDFKRVNDTYGHAGGDEVLVRIARTLEHASRSEDIVARFAGDEFMILLVDVDPIVSRSLVHRISYELQAAGLSCSLGAADYPRDAMTASELLAAADGALYRTKAAGKNEYSFKS